ncbi:hypothetical protein [Caballeronia novacaledonica]|uniref:Uncharacterized protein n=1 Tax=Caballeronia novacaledonica TaxID=1544861 RepID=A0AA37IBH7_9BURK|nr:hypothetical protein [Caballeronia novacaledonica]GJH26288.1 hypothetical protein CBA19CS42_17250 [Caballeronia novacaledonica]
MNQRATNGDEAAAVARVAEAAREVQAASVALEAHFNEAPAGGPPTLLLARLAAAMSELQQARGSFDKLFSPEE